MPFRDPEKRRAHAREYQRRRRARLREEEQAEAPAEEETGSYEEARTRMMAARAQEAEMRLAVMRRELVPSADVVRELDRACGEYRARTLAVRTAVVQEFGPDAEAVGAWVENYLAGSV